jgi:tRNA threonylcarbamoyladenosine biosynthesis protein TsaE
MNLTTTIASLRADAVLFLNSVKTATVIAFHGEMGSGKTTLIHAICEVLGVEDTVGSPTFSIINQYNYMEEGQKKRLYHIDLYRLNGEEEAHRAGVEDCLYSGDRCLVEWPEKAPALFPPDTLHVYISITGPDSRTLAY